MLAGKSTAASMLAYVLHAMGDDLTAVVGAHVPQVSSYSLWLRQCNILASIVFYLHGFHSFNGFEWRCRLMPEMINGQTFLLCSFLEKMLSQVVVRHLC